VASASASALLHANASRPAPRTLYALRTSFDVVRREGLSQSACQRGIVALPDFLSRPQFAKIHRVTVKGEFHQARRDFFFQWSACLSHVEDATALFLARGPVAFKDQTVTGLQPPLQVDTNTPFADIAHFAKKHASLGRIPGRYQRLVIAPVQPAHGEPAGERQLHFLHLPWCEGHRSTGHGGVNRLSIVPRDVGNVLGSLQSPLDLEGRDTRLDQLRNQRIGRQILGTEQVLLITQIDVTAVADQLIRQPARLCALAAIGAASAERFTRQALAAVRHAQCPVDKDFQRHGSPPMDHGDLAYRQFAGQDHAIDPQPLGLVDALRTGERHLRRGVNGQLGSHAPDDTDEAQILNEHGIGPGLGNSAHGLFERLEFVRERQNVDGDVARDSVTMQEREQIGQLLQRKTGRSSAGVESGVEPEIDGIRSIGDRGFRAVPVSCR
jgi:hypothetical protein